MHCYTILKFEDTILDAVISATSQRFSDYSVVVSDNASEDSTIEKLASVTAPNLTVISNDQRVGKSENWNRAYAQADDCEYFVNLHSDDILFPGALNHIDSYLDRKFVFLHGADQRISYSGSRVLKSRYFPLPFSLSGKDLQQSLLIGNTTGIVGTTIQREAYETAGGWSNRFVFYQDVELWFQLAGLGRSLYIPKLLGKYRAPAKVSSEAFLAESILWHEEKLAMGLGPSLDKAACTALKRLTDYGLKHMEDFSHDLRKELMRVAESDMYSNGYVFGSYAMINAQKLRGVMNFAFGSILKA